MYKFSPTNNKLIYQLTINGTGLQFESLFEKKKKACWGLSELDSWLD